VIAYVEQMRRMNIAIMSESSGALKNGSTANPMRADDIEKPVRKPLAMVIDILFAEELQLITLHDLSPAHFPYFIIGNLHGEDCNLIILH
jgi:hypothetical protein